MKKENEKIELDGAHYRRAGRAEAIETIEAFLDDECGIPAKRKFLVGNALKYLLRLGRKGGPAGTEADLYKAENYLHRARTGKWIAAEKEAER